MPRSFSLVATSFFSASLPSDLCSRMASKCADLSCGGRTSALSEPPGRRRPGLASVVNALASSTFVSRVVASSRSSSISWIVALRRHACAACLLVRKRKSACGGFDVFSVTSAPAGHVLHIPCHRTVGPGQLDGSRNPLSWVCWSSGPGRSRRAMQRVPRPRCACSGRTMQRVMKTRPRAAYSKYLPASWPTATAAIKVRPAPARPSMVRPGEQLRIFRLQFSPTIFRLIHIALGVAPLLTIATVGQTPAFLRTSSAGERSSVRFALWPGSILSTAALLRAGLCRRSLPSDAPISSSHRPRPLYVPSIRQPGEDEPALAGRASFKR